MSSMPNSASSMNWKRHRKRRQYQHRLVGVLDVFFATVSSMMVFSKSGIRNTAPTFLDGVARNVFLIIEKSGRHPRGIYAVIRWLVPFAVYEALVIQCKRSPAMFTAHGSRLARCP